MIDPDKIVGDSHGVIYIEGDGTIIWLLSPSYSWEVHPDMAVINYGRVDAVDRGYNEHYYRVERYEKSGKINLYVGDTHGAYLKLGLEETKELILRLQYAVHEAEAESNK